MLTITASPAFEAISASELERRLRELLRPVQLICEAEIPGELVDAAERGIMIHVDRGSGPQGLGARCPATLATFVSVRGAEQYTANTFWPALGPLGTHQKEAGDEYLIALRCLGLPDFHEATERDRARSRVTPALIHGGFPAARAHDLLDQLRDELKRGLVDGEDARQRLLRLSDVDQVIGRPGRRLFELAPEFGAHLLDVLIDRLTGDPAGRFQLLPFHLQAALDAERPPTGRYRRLLPPAVVFQLWTGQAPCAVGRDQHAWQVEEGSTRLRLARDEEFELSPTVPARATRGNHQVDIWEPSDPTFFSIDGCAIRPTDPLPHDCVALHRASTHFRFGESNPVVERGVPLSGAWSHWVSSRLDLRGRPTLLLHEGTDRAHSRRVETASVATLDGEVIEHARTPQGWPVYQVAPWLVVPPGWSEVDVWAQGPGQCCTFHTLRHAAGDRPGAFRLDAVLGDGPWIGELQVRADGGKRHALGFAVAPGLTVRIPDGCWAGPGEAIGCRVTASPGTTLESQEPEFEVADREAQVWLGTSPPASLHVALPRVEWCLRPDTLRRLELGGEARLDVDRLLAESHVLVVRTGRPTSMVVGIDVDGDRVQSLPPVETSPHGWARHTCTITLDRARDTLRHHRSRSIAIILEIADSRLVAARCSEATASPPLPPKQVSKWEPESWRRQELSPRSTTAVLDLSEPGHPITVLRRRLKTLEEGARVVEFLAALGRFSKQWSKAVSGPSGPPEWRSLCRVADELWSTEGVRHRNFNGRDLGRLRQWTNGALKRIEELDASEKAAVEHWVLRHCASGEALDRSCVRTCAPGARPKRLLVWYPASVFALALGVMVGDEAAQGPLASAVRLTQAMALEVVAACLIVARDPEELFHRDQPPRLPSSEVVGPEAKPGDVAGFAMPAALAPIDPSMSLVEVQGRTLHLLTESPSAAGPVRLVCDGRAHALLHPRGGPHRFTYATPPDLAGQFHVVVADNELCLAPPTGGPLVLFDAVAPRCTGRTRTNDLRAIVAAWYSAEYQHVARLLAAGAWPSHDIDAMLDDPTRACHALLPLATRVTSEELDRFAIAALPSTIALDDLRVTQATAETVRKHSQLLYASLCPRTAAAWAPLGWPGQLAWGDAETGRGGLVRRAKQLEASSERWPTHTALYQRSLCSDPNGALTATLDQLRRAATRPEFTNILVATFTTLTCDAVTPEAIRMLLDAYREAPVVTEAGVLAGLAQYHACRHA